MFCPDCGTENSRSQKFCVRCGTNLVVVEQARSIIQDVGVDHGSDNIQSSTVLKTVGIISALGFLFITVGTVILSLIYQGYRDGPPLGLFFALGGFASLVLIITRLLRLIDKAPIGATRFRRSSLLPLNQPHTTRSLPERDDPNYYSVTEERTRQFER